MLPHSTLTGRPLPAPPEHDEQAVPSTVDISVLAGLHRPAGAPPTRRRATGSARTRRRAAKARGSAHSSTHSSAHGPSNVHGTHSILGAQLAGLHGAQSSGAHGSGAHRTGRQGATGGGPRRRHTMRDTLAAAALTAAVLTSATLAVDREQGEPIFPGLTSAVPLPEVPEPTPPAIAAPQPPVEVEATAPAAPAEPEESEEPGAPTVPVGPKVVFVADYRTGDFSQWGTCQSALVNGSCDGVSGDRQMTVVPAQVPGGGRYAARFTVRDGDVPEFGGGERAEVSENEAGAETREGDERWYEWSMRLPDDFRTPSGDWFIVMQWHSGNGSPPLAIDLSRGRVDIGGDGSDAPRKTIGPLRRGEWVHYVMRVKFSRSDAGFVEAWENGRQTVPRFYRPTMSSSKNYLKQGIYRDGGDGGTSQVELAGLRVTAP